MAVGCLAGTSSIIIDDNVDTRPTDGDRRQNVATVGSSGRSKRLPGPIADRISNTCVRRGSSGEARTVDSLLPSWALGALEACSGNKSPGAGVVARA
jgi:hypothetical protein